MAHLVCYRIISAMYCMTATIHRVRMRLHFEVLFGMVVGIPHLGVSMPWYAASMRGTQNLNILLALGDSYWLVSWPQAKHTNTQGLRQSLPWDVFSL